MRDGETVKEYFERLEKNRNGVEPNLPADDGFSINMADTPPVIVVTSVLDTVIDSVVDTITDIF